MRGMRMQNTPGEPTTTVRRRTRSSLLGVALGFALLAALLLVPCAQASKGVISSFGSTGSGAGQLNGVGGIAINRTGTGTGTSAGDVYVGDGNNRIQQFDAEGNPIRAFGWNVVASGPDNVTPANAVQSLSVPGSVTGGTYTLTYNGKTTAPLAFNATAAQVQSALVALSSIGGSFGNNVNVSGAASPYAITFVNELGDTPVPAISADSSNLTGGSATVSPVTTGVSGYEVCDVKANPTDVCQAGEAGVRAGALGSVNGIAVDQSNGNLYITESFGNNRIDVYSAAGAFEGAFAWGVLNGSHELQFCTTTCLKGFSEDSQTSGGAGEFNPGGGIGKPDVAPAGSPSEGDLYLADSGNDRIDEFKPTLTAGAVTGISFVRAIGWDVVESGPDNVPGVSEVQSIEIPAAVTGGTFKVSFEGETTAAIPFNASKKELGKAFENLGLGAQVSGGPLEHIPYTITFAGSLAEVNVPQLTVDNTKLIGGEATVETLTQGISPIEVCNVSAHPTDICKRGADSGQLGRDGQLEHPQDVGVDSTGAIYAADSSPGARRVEKYNADGSFDEEFAPANLTAAAEGLAPSSLAIDPSNGHVFVTKKISEETGVFEIFEFDSAGNLLGTSPAGGLQSLGEPAVGNEEKLYVGSGSRILILGTPPAPSATLGPVTAVTANSATFSGTVTPPTPGLFGGFATFYHFEYSTDGLNWSRVPAEEDAAAGDGTGAGSPDSCPVDNPPSCNVTETVTDLQPGITYHVRLVATTGTSVTTPEATFATEAAKPSISGSEAEVEQSTATLIGFVNPNNQASTYRFEWGPTTEYGNTVPDASAGSGGVAVKVSAPLTGLEPDTTYHFRIVATNGSGTTTGPDQEFTTVNAAGLPDNRRAELVSPADKRPQGTVQAFKTEPFQASEDGQAFVYPILNGLLDTSAGGGVTYLAKRGAAEWASEQVSAPALVPPPEDGLGSAPSSVHYFTPDLSCGLIESYEPLTADTPAADVELGVRNLYRINADGSHTLVSNTVPSNPTESNFPDKVGGMSPDCSRVYFTSEYKLLPGASGLYEWHDGTLVDAGLLPDGTVPTEEFIFGGLQHPLFIGGPGRANAVSSDGRRLFFTAVSDEGKDEGKRAVFLREDGATVDVSQTTTTTAPLGARYEIASADGSHVFFSANYGLTPSSSSGPSSGSCADGPSGEAAPCDIYDYDTETNTLTDLSADSNPADTNGAVTEGVLDASEDGSDVYFAALGQLVPNEGNTYKQNLAGQGFANVYLSHEGNLSYVGILTKADLLSALARGNGTSQPWQSQATPDGRHLLFASAADVTGYVSGGAQEAYLYSAESGTTVCVSCRRDGAPSLGSASDSPIANQPPRRRSLSDDGSRVFFTMRDPLAPGAIAGDPNIYEWEKGQVYLLNDGGGVEPRFLGASASGDDAFLASTEQLDAHDTDFVGDVYDLRVNGGYPPPEEPPAPCEPAQDQCQGAPAVPPPAQGSPSAGFNGPGNPPLAAPGKPKHKKTHKRHRHKKAHKRQAKRANANRGGSK
jgi:hypothetical protein